MNDTNHSDDWRVLCELASKERDPRKLLDLIMKINRALEECRQRKQNEQTSLKVVAVLLPRPARTTDRGFHSFPGRPELAIEYDC